MTELGVPAITVTLPITGWQAGLLRADGQFPLLYLRPSAGAPLICTLLGRATQTQILLGAHHEFVSGPTGRGPAVAALAYGVMPVAGEPEVAFVWRRLLGRDRRTVVPPVLFEDLVWLAEARGRFDEVRVSAGPHRLSRLI